MVYSIASLFHHYIILLYLATTDIKKPKISGSILYYLLVNEWTSSNNS